MKYLTLLALSLLFFLTRSFAQDCSEWATTLADARFYDTSLVIVLSPDYDQLLYPVNPPVKPDFIHVTKNMLHGAPAGEITEQIEMLKEELINERLYLSNDEYKKLFLRKMAVLIFFDFASVRDLEISLIQTINDLKADDNDLISRQALIVYKVYDFYLSNADNLFKWKRPVKSKPDSLVMNIAKDGWPKIYWKYKRVISFDLIETYDKGYIILGSIRPDGITQIWAWVIKTDINGEILWEKIIGDGLHVSGFNQIYQTDDGGYVLGGATYLLDYHADPFFMKLNACGEKEWCRIFYQAGPTTAYCGGLDIYPVPGEDAYIALVSSWGDEFIPGVFKGIWLFKVDSTGNLIWIKNVFDQVDPNAWNELPYSMLMSTDTNCIITGWTIYNDFGGSLGYDKPFIMSAGTDGSEKWWYINGANSYSYGDVEQSVEDKSGNILTTGWGWHQGSEGYYPLLLKTDKFGAAIYMKYIIDSTEGGKAICLNEVNDSIYDIGGGWWYPGQPGHSAIARTDTNGNLILEKNVLENNYMLRQSLKTFDNKELFAGENIVDGFMKIYLHKFNFDLEYDSAYTQPFEYDYMCDNLPIITDTIGITDCDVWTGLPGDIEYRLDQYLVIFPCPAENEITIRLPAATADEHKWGPMTSRHFNHRYHDNSVLRIYDIFGRLITEIQLKDIQGNELQQDVSGYAPGIYLINLLENQKLMASGKFVMK
jgi:hypothetical protein